MENKIIETDNAALRCHTCFESYDSSERTPRMLKCGHTFCHTCLTNSSSWGMKEFSCHDCHRISNFDGVEDIPVNYSLKDCAEKGNQKEDLCRDHGYVKNWECITCQMMMCATCGLLNHKSCQINYATETLKQKKESLLVAVQALEKSTETTISQMQVKCKFINNTKIETNSDLQSMERNLESNKEKVMELNVKLTKINFMKDDVNEKLEEINKFKTTSYNRGLQENKDKLEAFIVELKDMVASYSESLEILTGDAKVLPKEQSETILLYYDELSTSASDSQSTVNDLGDSQASTSQVNDIEPIGTLFNRWFSSIVSDYQPKEEDKPENQRRDVMIVDNDDDSICCDICSEVFDSRERTPRMLNCGHTFCQTCLTTSSVGKKNLLCSVCQQITESTRVDHIPINYAIKQWAEKGRLQKSDVLCNQHNSIRNFECITCQTMICGTCGLLNHKSCDTKYVGETLTKKFHSLASAVLELEKVLSKMNIKCEGINQLKADINDVIERMKGALEEKKETLMELNVKLTKIHKMEGEISESLEDMKRIKTSTFNTSFNQQFDVSKLQLESQMAKLETIMFNCSEVQEILSERITKCELTPFPKIEGKRKFSLLEECLGIHGNPVKERRTSAYFEGYQCTSGATVAMSPSPFTFNLTTTYTSTQEEEDFEQLVNSYLFTNL